MRQQARRSWSSRALEAPPLGRLPDNAGRAAPPAPRPSAPRTRRGRVQSAAAALLQPAAAALLSEAGGRAEAGAPSFPPPPAAMSQGSPGDWPPLEPTSGPSAPPNPFVHELHLSRLQKVKVRCGRGSSGGLWDKKKRSFRVLAKVGMGLKERRWVRGLRSGSRGVRTWGRRGWAARSPGKDAALGDRQTPRCGRID